jgi:protein Mpv17
MAALTLVRAYQQSFDTHPNITLSIAGGCLNALGDCVAQVAEGTVRNIAFSDWYISHNSIHATV